MFGPTVAPAQAATVGPSVQPQRPAAVGHRLAMQTPRPDPSAAQRLSQPDKVVWPATALDRAVSTRAGFAGPLFRVTEAGRFSVSYAQFEHAYGGDWGARAKLSRLPACVLSTPDKPECRVSFPTDSINNTAARTVSADAQPGMVLALEAGDASAQGDYKATSLAKSSSWETALSSGGFSWSYPMRTPAVPSGLAPQVSLQYSSQSVDGRTAATNNQGSWIGEGLSYEPGYLERSYKPCSDDGHTGSAEQCWAFQNATLMLSGHSGQLVKIDDNTWKLSNDDGSAVQRLVGAVNGDDDGEYWKITTSDGTQYFFGLNRLPGYSAGNEETESVWTRPVYGDDSGEPCYNSSGFSSSYCNQAWRWNLDYVIDPRDNVLSYFYDTETNYYARDGRTDVNGTAYIRGGYLAHIDYGQRNNEVYTTSAPARVVFTVAERCLLDASSNCTSYPDVPEDLVCAAGTHCNSSQVAPTFFTRKRLAKVETQIRQGSSWSAVEAWTIEHVFYANDDNSRTLWLKKINHSGLRGGTLAGPAVELDGIQLPNRVDSPTDGVGPLVRFRLNTVKTETGTQLSVVYKAADCSPDALPQPDINPKRCYPVKWNPFGGGNQNKITDWFHKYVVDHTVEDDLVGGNPDMVSSYEYVGDAAWAKAKPDGITKTEDLTWNDWRGYAKVIVRTGDGQVMPTKVEHTLLRGMGGTVTDSTGKSYTDIDGYSGLELESIGYNGSDIVSKTINEPRRWVTHTQTESWGTVEAAFVRTETARNLTALSGNTWRETKTVTAYDPALGRVTQVDDLTDAGDKCIRTEYADIPAKHMYSYPSREYTVSVDCATSASLETQLLSDGKTTYNATGTAIKSESLHHVTGTTISYVTTSETTSVDVFGRALVTKDAMGYATTTAYTETSGLTTQTQVTNALSHVVTTTLDPGYGVATVLIDPNALRTDLSYDPLGRLSSVWRPDRTKSLGATPNIKFSYLMGSNKPTVVVTEKIENDGSYRATYDLFDGHLRPRQSQSPGADGAWLLIDTFHNGTGQIAKTNAAYLATGTAGDVPIVVAEGSVNGQIVTTYDGAGRVITETTMVAGTPKWSTTTSYGGDRVNFDPPAGGVPTTTVVNSRGLMTELHQYQGNGPTGAADITRYTYNAAGSLASVTDPLGNEWKYWYDQRNLKILTEDPDAGDIGYTYDNTGRQTSITDARGVKISYKFDELGRKVEAWQGEIDSGTKLTASVYDTIAKGQLYSTNRYIPGGNYFIRNTVLDKLYRPLTTRYVVPGVDVGSTQTHVSFDFTTAYNIDGSVQSIGMPAAGDLPAETLVTSYDSLLRPVALTGNNSYVTAASYSNVGELLQATLHTGGTNKKTWLSRQYERGTSRLVNSSLDVEGTASPSFDATYAYDDTGNIQSIADSSSGETQTFTYDYLRRLRDATATGGPAPYHQTWDFDKVGNRTTETSGATTRSYTHPTQGQGQNQPHALSRVDESGPAGTVTYNYTYDAAGNTKTRPGQSLNWDDEGHLASVTPAGGQPTSYVYDANGARLVSEEPTATTVYLNGMELRLNKSTGIVNTTRYYGFGGITVATRSASGVTFVAADHHGTNVSSIDSLTGAVTFRRTTPYGDTRGTPPASWPDRKGFVGGTQDATGLTHLGAREYDPTLGRFISADPIMDLTDPQQWHAYAYSHNSPVTSSDPSGLKPQFDDIEDQRAWQATQKPAPKSKCTGNMNSASCRGAPPPTCSEKKRNYCRGPGENTTGPYGLGISWLTGWYTGCPFGATRGVSQGGCDTGPNDSYVTRNYFRDGDPYTESLKRLRVMSGARERINAQLLGRQTSGRANVHYKDSDKADRGNQSVADGIGVLTGGLFGSDPAQSFTGSFDLSWEVVGYDDRGNPVVEFHLENASTWSSATTNPVGDYPDGGGSAANGADASPGERWSYQSVRWRETVVAYTFEMGGITGQTHHFVDQSGVEMGWYGG